MTSLLVFWFIIYVLAGSFWYMIDRKACKGLYRGLHNLTHDKAEELPPNAPKAFVYGQPTARRFYVAIVLSTLQIFLIAHGSEQDRLADLTIWFLGIPALLIGFFIGPQIFRLWSKKEDVFSAMDRVEAGEEKIAPKLTANIAAKWLQWKQSFAAPKPPAEAAPESPKLEKPAPAPEADPRAAIDKFTKKK